MPRVVAIDLGHYSVKATVFDTSGRSVELEGHYSEPVMPDIEFEDTEDDGPKRTIKPSLGARLAALDNLLEDNHSWQAPSTVVALAWPAGDAAVRIVTLPFSDRNQVEQTLPYTVEELVPFDLDEMVLAWRALTAETGTRALVCLARRTWLESTIEGLHQRDVDPVQVNLDGEGVGTLVANQGSVAVVDVGHHRTTVTVIVDGQVVHTRAIDVGGERFTRAISTAMRVSMDEAHEYKHGAYHNDEEPTDGGKGAILAALPPGARSAVDQTFGLLLAEIRSTLLDAEDRHGLDLTKVYLTGGGSRLEPLDDYLRRDLGLTVEPLVDAWGERVPLEHAVSHGLARAVAEGTRLIDLRVGSLAYKGGVNVLRAVVTYGAAGVAFFLLASVIVFGIQYKGLLDQQSDVDGRIEALVMGAFPTTDPALLANSEDAALLMKGLVEREEQRADKIAPETRVPPTIDLLHELTNAFPPHTQVTVDVRDLTINQAAITFTAETDGYEAAAQVETSLQAVEAFAAATKGEERRRRDKVEFNMTIPLIDEGGL